MVEDDDLRAVFFDPDDFGEEVTITPNGADPFTVMAIFDVAPVVNPVALSKAQVGYKGGFQDVGFSPQFRCRSSDVSNVKAGRATCVARGLTYNVWDIKPDGTGLTIIIMKVA